MRFLRGTQSRLLTFVGTILSFVIQSGDYFEIGSGGRRIYFFTTALAPGDASTVPAGSFGITTNATGQGQIFVADGSNWHDYNAVFVSSAIATITTTGAVSALLSAPVTGKLIAAGASFTDALAAHDTNYSTQTLVNLSNSNAAMLAVADTNTTKATGGSAFVAHTPRYQVLHGTAGNLAVTRGHRLQYTFTATGTLANTLTNGQVFLVFSRTV